MKELKLFQKYSDDGYLCKPNAVYDAYVDNDFYYMNFYEDYFFKRELEGLNLIANKLYSPEVISVDENNLIIKIKWYDSNLNHLLYKKESIPDDWKEQINSILKDLISMNIYKVNIYPHTFYVKENKIKILDLYACSSRIHYDKIKDIINDKNRFFFKNGFLHTKKTFEYTVKKQKEYWTESFIKC